MQVSRQLVVLAFTAFLAGCATGDETSGAGGIIKGFIGGVAADEPRAALEGRKVLAAGGSAADAAVAVYFSLAVTLPSAASLGGGGVCLAFDAGKNRIEALDFLSRAPTPQTGTVERPNAVPGNALGFFALHSRFGRLPWARVVTPGERLARFGTPVSRALARELKGVSTALLEDQEARRIFARDGKVLGEGDFLQQRELSAVLSSIRSRGPGNLYRGDFAKVLVDGVVAAGGGLTLADLRNFRPAWRPTVEYAYGNQFLGQLVMHAMPPPAAAGLVAAQMWAMLEAQGGFSSADETDRNHLMAETSMRAFADRAAWLGADFQASVPPEAIVAEQRLSRLLANFDGNRHLSPSRLTPPPVARAENPSATSFVAVDRGGSAVACSLTMNNVFGTGRVARGTGVILAAQPGNEGRGPLPLGPIMIINKIRSNLIFAGAASGGAPAPTSLAAVTARTVLAEQPLAAALRHPRIHHGGAPDITFHEPKLDAIVRAGLIGRGHRLGTTQSLGRVNAVHCPGGLTREPSGCIVAVDPRGDGLATTASQ